MGHRDISRSKLEGEFVRQRRAARRSQIEAARRIQPAADALRKYGNLAVAVTPGAPETQFVASLMSHYAKIDKLEGTSTNFVDINARGAVYGIPMDMAKARRLITQLAHFTREPAARGVVIIRGVDHVESSRRRIGGDGHPALREGLVKLIRREPGNHDPQSLEPAVMAIGGISGQAVSRQGTLSRAVTGEDFIDAFHAHMVLHPDGTLARYKVIPNNCLFDVGTNLSLGEGQSDFRIEFGGVRLG
jgi:hypothetical protein